MPPSLRNVLVRWSSLPPALRFAPSHSSMGPRVAWVAGYVGIVFFLKRFDPFDADFDTAGPVLLLYNAARVGFLIYFTSILVGLGLAVLGPLEKAHLPRLAYLDRLLLGFWLGAAVLTLLMLPLGFLRLYYPATALVLTIPLLAFTFSPLRECFVEGKRRWAGQRASLPSLIAAGSILGLLLLLLLTRSLYPGETTNDVYEHYWPYQREVLRLHGLWPNDVWYDFYTAKGFGLHFLAMLLTDDLAGQSVTFILVAASAGLLFAVTRRLTGQSLWAWLSTVAYLGAFPFPLAAPWSWGGFQSHHLPAAAWLACLTWMAVLTLDEDRLHRGTWFGVWFLLAAGCTVFFPPFALFSLSLLAILAALLWLRKQRPAARCCFLVWAGIAGLLGALLLVNYAATGLLNDNPKRVTWALADQEKFGRWCSPYLVEFFNEISEAYEGALNAPGFSHRSVRYFERLGRLHYLRGYYPGRAGAILLILAAGVGWRRSAAGVRGRHPVLLIAFLAAAVVIGEVLKLDASVYRNYVFLLFFECGLLGLAWKLAFAALPPKLSARLVPVFAAAVVAITGFSVLHRQAARQTTGGTGQLTDYLRFAVGQFSIQEALARGDGLWPEAVAAKKRVGVNTPILCLSRVNYALPGLASHAFPGNGLLTEPSRTSLGGQWHVVAFEDAASARRALEGQGVHYFLIDPSHELTGCIPFSPLFEPQGLTERFEVVQSWGNLHLLTWPGNGGRRLSPQFVQLFEERLAFLRRKQVPYVRLSDILAAFYRFNRDNSYPLRRPPGLPRFLAIPP